MKRSEDILQKIDSVIKKYGMEEEIDKLMEDFTGNYMIQGELTENLEDALRRAPDGLLDMIWDTIACEEPAEAVLREQKEEILYQEIQKDLEKNMLCMDIQKLHLLLKVAFGAPVDILYTEVVNREFVPRGWVFNFLENGSCTFVVMDELITILRRLEEPETKKQFGAGFYIRSVVNICLGLYGVVTQEQINQIYQEILREEDDRAAEEISQDIQRLLVIFEKQNMLWRDGSYIISPYLQTKEDYMELLEKQRGKEYYNAAVNDDVVRTYGLGKILLKTPEYKAVHKCLTRELKDSDMAEEMLEEIAGYVIRDDWGIPQIMNCLYRWDVAFDNRKTASRLTGALSQWLYGIHRWSECGFSRKELQKENEEMQYVDTDSRQEGKTASAKIYPNDPCPCGSGKKYKKCCGK